jgi:hypothetical protein
VKVFLPPLHIKLGLVNNFVNDMKKKFSLLIEAKIKGWNSAGPQIRKLTKYKPFFIIF